MEVGIVLERRGERSAIEVQSGETVSSKFSANLVRLKELARERGDRRAKVESLVSYGENERQARTAPTHPLAGSR